MSDDDLVTRIKREHGRVKLRLGDRNPSGTNRYSNECSLCREPWPCDAVKLLQHIEELQRSAPKVSIRHVGDEHEMSIEAMSGEVLKMFESNPMYEITIIAKGRVYEFKASRMVQSNESDAVVQMAGFLL